ncbi:MAG: hypothetical protein LAO31_02090 [Acidobacteriia bacterium]|nr:hypothetical protein [Terriglobia bacterium]
MKAGKSAMSFVSPIERYDRGTARSTSVSEDLLPSRATRENRNDPGQQLASTSHLARPLTIGKRSFLATLYGHFGDRTSPVRLRSKLRNVATVCTTVHTDHRCEHYAKQRCQLRQNSLRFWHGPMNADHKREYALRQNQRCHTRPNLNVLRGLLQPPTPGR